MDAFLFSAICLLLFFIHIIGRKANTFAGWLLNSTLIIVLIYTLHLCFNETIIAFPINLFTITVAVLLGIPGILSLIAINIFVFL